MEISEKKSFYRATVIKGGKIILEPDAWLFEPKNKELLRHIKESLHQEATINLGSFKKHA